MNMIEPPEPPWTYLHPTDEGLPMDVDYTPPATLAWRRWGKLLFGWSLGVATCLPILVWQLRERHIDVAAIEQRNAQLRESYQHNAELAHQVEFTFSQQLEAERRARELAALNLQLQNLLGRET